MHNKDTGLLMRILAAGLSTESERRMVAPSFVTCISLPPTLCSILSYRERRDGVMEGAGRGEYHSFGAKRALDQIANGNGTDEYALGTIRPRLASHYQAGIFGAFLGRVGLQDGDGRGGLSK